MFAMPVFGRIRTIDVGVESSAGLEAEFCHWVDRVLIWCRICASEKQLYIRPVPGWETHLFHVGQGA